VIIFPKTQLLQAEASEPWFSLELTVKEGQEEAFLEIFKDNGPATESNQSVVCPDVLIEREVMSVMVPYGMPK